MSESIKDVLRELREFADTDSQSIGRDVLRREIQHFANRIEAAYKHEVDGYKGRIKLWSDRADELRHKCDEQYAELKRGRNNAKMREALEKIDKNTDLLDIAENIAPELHPSHSFVAVQIRKIVCAALSEPPRNCDLPTVIADPHSAWLKDSDNWDDFGSPEKEIHDWLLAKAKGENNE